MTSGSILVDRLAHLAHVVVERLYAGAHVGELLGRLYRLARLRDAFAGALDDPAGPLEIVAALLASELLRTDG